MQYRIAERTEPCFTPLFILKRRERFPFQHTLAYCNVFILISSRVNIAENFWFIIFQRVHYDVSKALVMSIVQVKTSDPF